jgi:pimeloyl-ACP methyl ester carboxylesterase
MQWEIPGKFHLVGHDWGSAADGQLLLFNPERIQSWTA